MLDDHFKKGVQIIVQMLIQTSFSLQTIRVYDWEIQKLIISIELNKKIKCFIQCVFRVGIASFNFVDDNDGWDMLFDSLLEHKSGLGFRSFNRVNNQQGAVHHVHNAFNFTAKISMTRRVYDVNAGHFTILRVWH